MTDISPWEVGFGITSHRITPTVVKATSGDYVFCIGSETRGVHARLGPGDYIEVTQTADFGGTLALVRATLSWVSHSSPPIGFEWQVSILIDDVAIVTRTIGPELKQRVDLASNVSSLVTLKYAIRLTLAGVGEPQLVELPALFIDSIIVDGVTV